jgi:hypothetical protein
VSDPFALTEDEARVLSVAVQSPCGLVTIAREHRKEWHPDIHHLEALDRRGALALRSYDTLGAAVEMTFSITTVGRALLEAHLARAASEA